MQKIENLQKPVERLLGGKIFIKDGLEMTVALGIVNCIAMAKGLSAVDTLRAYKIAMDLGPTKENVYDIEDQDAVTVRSAIEKSGMPVEIVAQLLEAIK